MGVFGRGEIGQAFAELFDNLGGFAQVGLFRNVHLVGGFRQLLRFEGNGLQQGVEQVRLLWFSNRDALLLQPLQFFAGLLQLADFLGQGFLLLFLHSPGNLLHLLVGGLRLLGRHFLGFRGRVGRGLD